MANQEQLFFKFNKWIDPINAGYARRSARERMEIERSLSKGMAVGGGFKDPYTYAKQVEWEFLIGRKHPKNIPQSFVSYPPQADSPLPGLPSIMDPMQSKLSKERQRQLAVSRGVHRDVIESQRDVEYRAAQQITNYYDPDDPVGFVPSDAARAASEKLENRKIWQKGRDIEESLWMGEHSTTALRKFGKGKSSIKKLVTTPSETLSIIGQRMKAWGNVDPTSIPMRAMIDELGMDPRSAKYLSSGRASGKLWSPLRSILSFKLAEKEVIGSPRVASFGHSLEPGSSYIGLLESGRVMSISEENQRRFAGNIFGATKTFRFAGTGKILTNKEMSKLKFGIPGTTSYRIREGSELADFVKSTDLRMKELRELAVAEARERWEARNKVQGFGAGEERTENINEFSTRQQLGMHAYGSEEMQEEAAFHSQYDPEKNLYWNRYRELRDLKNKAFRYKKSKLTWVSPDIKSKFRGQLTKMAQEKVSLHGKSRDEMEAIIEEQMDMGRSVYYGGRGVSHLVTKSPLGGFKEAYVSKLGSKEEATLYDLVGRYAVPSRAEAEKVFDVYFKRVGRGKFEAYTASGTFLGYSPRGPAGAVGKVFRYQSMSKDYFSVGWAESRNAFEWSRFGEIERAQIEEIQKSIEAGEEYAGEMPKEINKWSDLEKENRLRYASKQDWIDAQAKLERMYHQADPSDYDLISRYGGPSDLETDPLDIERYNAQVRGKYYSPETGGASAARAAEGLAEKIRNRIPKTKGLIFAALGLSAAMVVSSASAKRRDIIQEEDVSRSSYGSSTIDQRMFGGQPPMQTTARIVPEYQGRQGYTTNIDIQGTDTKGIDPRELASVMDRHARITMGTKSGGVNVEVNDNTSQENKYAMRNKYEKMFSA